MRRQPLILAIALTVALSRSAGADSVTPTAQASPTPKFVDLKGVHTDRSFTPSPEFAAWPHINLAEAQRLRALGGVVFADARAKVEWDQGHIPGALPAPLGEFDAYYSKNEARYKKARYIVVYCHGPGCHLSDLGCKHFAEKGYHNVVNFYQGWPGWSEAKLPIEMGTGTIVTPTPAPAVLTPKP